MFELSYCAGHSLLRDGMELDELCAAVAEAQIDSLELGVAGGLRTPGMEAEVLLESSRRLEDLRNTLRGYDLSISALNCVTNPIHPMTRIARENEQALLNTIELAHRLEVRKVVTASGCSGANGIPVWIVWPIFWDDLIEPGWEEAGRVWRRLAERSEKLDVELCLELHPGMLVYNVSGFRRLQEVAGTALRVNVDPSHLFYQGVDPIAVVHELNESVRFVHAKDTAIDEAKVAVDGYLDPSPLSAPGRSWAYRAVGVGHDLDWWGRFLAELKSVNYTGPLSIEHEDDQLHGAEGVFANAKALRHAMELVRSSSGGARTRRTDS